MKYSFVLPAYKSHFFKEALDSILTQTYKEFELIIVNDASPEDLGTIVHSYDDPRIRYYVNKENIGGKDLVAQWNHCLEYAQGEYIILASDDDIYHPEYLEKMNELVGKYPEVNAFKPRIQIIGADGKPLSIDGYTKTFFCRLEFLYAWFRGYIGSGIPQYVFKKNAINSIGGFISYPMAWFSDDATVISLAKKGVVSTNEILFSFRYSGDNITTQQNSFKQIQLKLEATKKFHSFIQKEINSIEAYDSISYFMKEWLTHNFSEVIRENKIRNQYFSASMRTILFSTKSLAQLECIRIKDIIRWYISYISTLF